MDLRGELPERFQQMLSAYERFVKEHAVLPTPPGYSQTGQLVANAMAKQFGTGIIIAILTILVLLPFFIVGRRKSP